MTPDQIILILSVVQALGTQIGSLLSAAKDGGATDEQIQTAYDEAHRRAMSYVPLTQADAPKPAPGPTDG